MLYLVENSIYKPGLLPRLSVLSVPSEAGVALSQLMTGSLSFHHLVSVFFMMTTVFPHNNGNKL